MGSNIDTSRATGLHAVVMEQSVAAGLRVAVVGASLGGLSAANVLHRLGAQVDVFESFPRGFHDRGGALGSVDVDLLKRITADSGPGVMAIQGHGHFYGDLWRYLYGRLPERTVHFGVDVREVRDAETESPKLQFGEECREFDLVIGADGGKSTIRPYVTAQQPKYAGYQVWRGLVPYKKLPHPIPAGRAASTTLAGNYYETLGFACPSPSGLLWNCGIYMATPEDEVQEPTRNRQVVSSVRTAPAWFVPAVTVLFGEQLGRFWADVMEHGKVSPHPVWEFAADVVVRKRVLLLGDAAHMATPRTGAGAYTAMLDAAGLEEAFKSRSILEDALQFYNSTTVRRGKELLRRSQQHATYFAPKPAISPAALPQLNFGVMPGL